MEHDLCLIKAERDEVLPGTIEGPDCAKPEGTFATAEELADPDDDDQHFHVIVDAQMAGRAVCAGILGRVEAYSEFS